MPIAPATIMPPKKPAIGREDIPLDPTRRRVWIQGELRLIGSSLTAIAASLGVSRQAVGQALLVPSERIEQAIADALGLPVAWLFPDRFGADGQRIPNTRPGNRITAQNARRTSKPERDLNIVSDVARQERR
ncbi:helix-turn-helix domain-containing protein [Inquilinus limosus]|uniref:helix-turn-helix domain-containing protein n=1 Tax=Inquilinus limosus TaxID=171674 RepID=UPI0006843E67|nr:helix-turn-helix domain-containing protein [Inquilinus limosus]